MAKVYIVEHNQEFVKCGSCNSRVANLFVLAEAEEDAQKLYTQGEAGLCGDCFSEMLEEEKYDIDIK